MNKPLRSLLSVVVFGFLSTLLYLSAPAGCGSGLKNPELCGNGALDEGEDCDDGNGVKGDGCSEDCDVEALDAGGGETDPAPIRCTHPSDCASMNQFVCNDTFDCKGTSTLGLCEDGVCTPFTMDDGTGCAGQICNTDPDNIQTCSGEQGVCGGD